MFSETFKELSFCRCSVKMLRAYSFRRKRAGQTTCECGKNYNNSCVPKSCDCGFELGGTFQSKAQERKTSGDAKLLKDLVSVRLNKQGINIRTFVSLTENKVCHILSANFVRIFCSSFFSSLPYKTF